MALKACRECGKEVSTEARACPHCGKKNPTEKGGCLWIFAALFVFLGLPGISAWWQHQPDKPQKAEKEFNLGGGFTGTHCRALMLDEVLDTFHSDKGQAYRGKWAKTKAGLGMLQSGCTFAYLYNKKHNGEWRNDWCINDWENDYPDWAAANGYGVIIPPNKQNASKWCQFYAKHRSKPPSQS